MNPRPTLDALLDLDPDAVRCPYPLFEELRGEAGLHFIEETGCYAVTRYDDILEVVRDPERFSSRMPTGPHAGGELMQRLGALAAESPEMAQLVGTGFQRAAAGVLLSADPPDHAHQRRLVNHAFGPRRVMKMEADIRSIAHGLIDEFIGRTPPVVELVHEFAVGLPLTVIAKALGVLDRELPLFKRWSDIAVILVGNHKPSRDQLFEYVKMQHEFADYFLLKIAERRVDPQDDLITDVVMASEDGDVLSDQVMLAMFQQFLVAGNETTTKLITSTMLRLAQDPSLSAAVRADRGLVEGLVEEVLRLETPVQGLYRQANVDTTIGGCPVKAGDHFWVLYASGNRDPSRFAEPELLDPKRDNTKQHLAFSQGPHYCIGQSLARAEGRIAVDALLDRFTDFVVAEGNDFRYEDSYVLHGLRALDLEFVPAAGG